MGIKDRGVYGKKMRIGASFAIFAACASIAVVSVLFVMKNGLVVSCERTEHEQPGVDPDAEHMQEFVQVLISISRARVLDL